MSGFQNEKELASVIIGWLRQFDWEVYQEVQPRRFDCIIDIVATRGSLLRVIECKMSFTAAVIEQAWRHRNYAHLVHVAIPRRAHRSGRMVLEKACKCLGVGILEATQYDTHSHSAGKHTIIRDVHELALSCFDRRAVVQHIRDSLCEEQKTFAPAGNADGLRFTPWKATCKRWAAYVRHNPGCTLKEIVSNVGHHYASDSSARISMARWIEDGRVDGITAKREGRTIRLHPAEVGTVEP